MHTTPEALFPLVVVGVLYLGVAAYGVWWWIAGWKRPRGRK